MIEQAGEQAIRGKKTDLIEQGWIEGSIFNREDCYGTDKGLGIFTGKWSKSVDGDTLEFTDGSHFLWEFLEIVTVKTPEIISFMEVETRRFLEDKFLFVDSVGINLEEEKEKPSIISELVEELSKEQSEGSYYHNWKSNIAMSIRDTYKSNPILFNDINSLADASAINFLSLLISE